MIRINLKETKPEDKKAFVVVEYNLGDGFSGGKEIIGVFSSLHRLEGLAKYIRTQEEFEAFSMDSGMPWLPYHHFEGLESLRILHASLNELKQMLRERDEVFGEGAQARDCFPIDFYPDLDQAFQRMDDPESITRNFFYGDLRHLENVRRAMGQTNPEIQKVYQKLEKGILPTASEEKAYVDAMDNDPEVRRQRARDTIDFLNVLLGIEDE